MKKYLFFILTAILFATCSDGDNNNIDEESISPKKSIVLKKDSIVLHQLERESIGVELKGLEFSEIVWSIGDSFVAKLVDSGALGYHVGQTYLYASAGNIKDSCKVIVKPKHTFFSEPICAWGKSRKYIREKETRKIIADHVGGHTSLAYQAGEGIINYQFSQPDSLLVSATVGLSDKDMLNAVDFLLERYNMENDIYFSKTTQIEITFGQMRSMTINYKPLK